MAVSILHAGVGDAPAIAALHIESWRTAYRGLLPDEFLDGPVFEDRRRLWTARMHAPGVERRLVLKAIDGDALLGFACVLLDAEPAWGALLDNLHVLPELKGTGIGRRLFQDARNWVGASAPGQRMHLTVMEGNTRARQFYDRQGGTVAERMIIEVVPGTRLAVLRYVWEPTSGGLR
jgi:GNAT superfamily N-acetyltransferase